MNEWSQKWNDVMIMVMRMIITIKKVGSKICHNPQIKKADAIDSNPTEKHAANPNNNNTPPTP